MIKKATASLNKWSQGVSWMDGIAGAAGLAASLKLPMYFAPSTATTTDKILRVGASALSAMAAGWAGKMVGGTAGKAAITGGFAGTAIVALDLFAGMNVLAGGGGTARRIATPRGRGLGTALDISPAVSRDGETVGVLEP